MDIHSEAVSRIASDIKGFYARQQPFRIYHGSTNSTRKSPYQRSQLVDTSQLNHVLSINTTTQTALCEPNVPMDALVAATLPHGLVPPVVMEFPGITVGGGFAGTGGESSSFKYGFFDKIVNWIEIVTADGQILKCSESENADLFDGAASSFGTLGVTTLLEVQLIPAKKYVALTHVPVGGMEEAVEVLRKATREEDVDFVDGIMFAKHRGVVCVGRLTDTPPAGSKIVKFTARSDPWFYVHVDRLLKSPPTSDRSSIIEAVPLKDYLFRCKSRPTPHTSSHSHDQTFRFPSHNTSKTNHQSQTTDDRGGFWVARYAFHYFLTPFNRITRWILDYYMHTRVMYHALHQSGLSSQYIIQDVAIPLPEAPGFLAYLDEDFQNYPIWLCPITQRGIRGTHTLRTRSQKNKKPLQRPGSSSGIIQQGSESENEGQTQEQEAEDLMLNFGVWGPGPTSRPEFIAWNRAFERKVHALAGQKWLYAHTYYTKEEFDDIYHTAPYHALRKKWKAEYLPSVYDKVRVDLEKEEREREGLRQAGWWSWLMLVLWSSWPFQGLWGVWMAAWGGEYLLPPRERGSDKTVIVESKKEL